MKAHVSLLATGILVISITAQTTLFDPVPFTSNQCLQDPDALFHVGWKYPDGYQILGGVPFHIPVGEPNFWIASEDATVLGVRLSHTGVVAVHTLINCAWGAAGESLARLELYGSDGTTYVKELMTNFDIRDFDGLGTPYANEINGTGTIEVFNTDDGQRLDKQRIELPRALRNQKLVGLRLIDSGADQVQRVFIVGITLEAVTGGAAGSTDETTAAAVPASSKRIGSEEASLPRYVHPCGEQNAMGSWQTIERKCEVVGW